MNKAFELQLAPGAEEIGLALMLRDLLTQNFEQHPEKIRDFRQLRLQVGLMVADAEVAVTLEFNRGTLKIHPGILTGCQLQITSEADLVLALSNVRVKWGLPYYFDGPGKEVLEAIKSRRIRIKGMVRNFYGLIRLSRILSVHGSG
ncbi:MAG: hypothetical protein HY892_16520 [Deltaproteobacteria bacterium]|nr:hypothetical protein [Deltaproteobacteria bacterium]